MNSNQNKHIIANGEVLLLLSFIGSLLFGHLSKEKQLFFLDNVLVRNLSMIVMIYLLVTLRAKNPIHPVTGFYNAIAIWILFLMFIKSNVVITIICIVLIMIYYVIGNYIDYNESEDNEYQVCEEFRKYQEYSIIGVVILLVIGYLLYMNDMYTKGQIFDMNTIL